jgi:hypothetical protein
MPILLASHTLYLVVFVCSWLLYFDNSVLYCFDVIDVFIVLRRLKIHEK